MSQPFSPDQSLDALARRLTELQPERAELSRDQLFYLAGQQAARQSRPAIAHRYLVVASIAIGAGFLLGGLGLQHRQIASLRRQVSDLRSADKTQTDRPALASMDRPSDDGPTNSSTPPVSPAPPELTGRAVPPNWAVSQLIEMRSLARGHFMTPFPANMSRSVSPPPTPLQLHNIARDIAELESGDADPPPARTFFWETWLLGGTS
jgi:hypothetical protein